VPADVFFQLGQSLQAYIPPFLVALQGITTVCRVSGNLQAGLGPEFGDFGFQLFAFSSNLFYSLLFSLFFPDFLLDLLAGLQRQGDQQPAEQIHAPERQSNASEENPRQKSFLLLWSTSPTRISIPAEMSSHDKVK